MGLDAYSAEEFRLKYGHEDILPREHLLRLLFFLKHTPPQRGALRMLGGEVHRVCSHLNGVVAEIRWTERLCEWNDVPHFPHFVTHYVDSMPLACIGGILCDVQSEICRFRL